MQKNPLELPPHLQSSAWDDAKFTVMGLLLLASPLILLGLAVLFVLSFQ